MAVYSRLLLSAGGGIVSAVQQAHQMPGIATVLIGLGGTGIQCIRTIKTSVYERLLPDDPEAVTPTYKHIRFLGVDTDPSSTGRKVAGAVTTNEDKKADQLLTLDDTEFFDISNNRLKDALQNEATLSRRDDITWLRWNDIPIPDLGEAGAGGVRQVGRFMMMDRSIDFKARILQEINLAKEYDAGKMEPAINSVHVHVFTGLSGGTGSGCFLDVCYMLKSLAAEIGGVTIFGYFFLPDVNLAKVSATDTRTRQYIPRNGFAAMQELDYCMQLQFNGGRFTQIYGGHTPIEWREPPVDMAHLICATNQMGDSIPNAYEYCMQVTAEYLMDFLTQSSADFGVLSQMANFRAKVNAANGEKTFGGNLAYCVLGASCATIPLREINTYLASRLFGLWSQALEGRIPTRQEVEKIACNAIGGQSVTDLYQALLIKLTERADDGYTPYPDGWKYVRENGNSRFVQHYTDQTANKLGQITSNQKSLLELGNQESIVAKICRQLNDAVVDLDRGPSYAWQTLNAAQSHNLLNIVDGLIKENTERQSQEAAQHNLRHTDYENAKAAFDGATGLFSNPGRAFGAYEFYLKALEQHDRMMGVYDAMDKMLRNLRRQLEELAAGYYVRLARVVETLMNSFKENYTLLVGKQQLKTTHFGTPMMSIEDLRPMLDRAVEEMNLRNKMQEFMEMLLQNSDQWLQEDERKITKLVTRFLVKDTFSEFASRTITSYLSIKYHTDNVDVLTQKIYDDWMLPLDNRAQPLFYLNGHIWSQVSELKQVSVPAEAAPVRMAAENAAAPLAWDIKPSQLTDRIYVMRTACALPLAAYQKCETYERDAYSIPEAGRHYYEGKGTEKMPFGNWQDLPTLTPLCLLPATLPDKLTKMVKRVRSVFEQARAAGLIGDEGQLYEQDTAAVQKLLEDAATLRQGLKNAAGLPEAEKVLKQLEEVAGSTLPMLPTEQKLLCDGYVPTQEARDIIMLDYLYQAPARIAELEVRLDLQKQLEGQVQEEIQQLKNTIYQLGKGARLQDAFFDAVFTDVIHLEGRVAVFIKQVSGISTEIYLSKRGEEFPFASIPVYQAFLSAQAMSEEDQKQMTRQVDDIYNTNAPILKENGARLKDELSVEQIQSWIQRAGDFPETAEITAFLTKLKQRFDLFCGEFKI